MAQRNLSSLQDAGAFAQPNRHGAQAAVSALIPAPTPTIAVLADRIVTVASAPMGLVPVRRALTAQRVTPARRAGAAAEPRYSAVKRAAHEGRCARTASAPAVAALLVLRAKFAATAERVSRAAAGLVRGGGWFDGDYLYWLGHKQLFRRLHLRLGVM